MTTIVTCLLALACGSGTASITGSDASSTAEVSSVAVSPSFVSLEAGGTADLSLEVTSSDGRPLDRAGTWKVEDPAVADLSGSGATRKVKALATGTARIVASVGGVSDTSTVDVAPEGGADPVVVFDPDLYSSTEELMDDPFGVFGGAELGEDVRDDGTGGHIVLDQDVARPDGGTQAMRYDYIDQGVNTPLRVGRRIPIPGSTLGSHKEVWVECEAKWSENFFAIQNFPQDGSTFAHKLLFGQAMARETSPNWETSEGWKVTRWSLLFPGGGSANPPNAQIQAETPRHADGGKIVDRTGANAANYFDARWHNIRVHWRHDPGVYELWIDGDLIYRGEGFTVHPEIDITAILLGRNKDDGIESGTESLWWGKMSIWTENPGW